MGERIAGNTGVAEDPEIAASAGRVSYYSQMEERKAAVGSPMAAVSPSKRSTLHDYAEGGDFASPTANKTLQEAAENEALDVPDPILNLTPLMICCKEGHLRAVKTLIKNGADVNLENVNHWTPLMLAVDGGHKAVVKILLAYGADIQFVGRYGYNVLHQAVLLKDHIEVLRLLVGEGSDRSWIHRTTRDSRLCTWPRATVTRSA
eukprot:6401727-Prymnesium_polylepis.1